MNGQAKASQLWDAFIPNRDGSANFGWRSDNDWKPFDGAIDDVAFYNKALTPEQIQTHYLASVKLTMVKSGDNLMISWPFGTLQQAATVTGPYTDISGVTSPYTITPSASAKFYRVKLQ